MTVAWPRRARPFTLIELMVVIAVILVLLALSLQAFSQVRARARMTSCLGQVRQIGLGVHLYLDRSEDFLPRCARLGPEPAYGLPSLQEVLEVPPEVYHCPADRPPDSLFAAEATSYEWNTLVSGRKVRQPSLKIAGLEVDAPILADGDPFHGGLGRNLLYTDGRVESSPEIRLE